MIVKDILPRLVRDKLWDKDCNGVVFLLSFLGDSFDILNTRGDDVDVYKRQEIVPPVCKTRIFLGMNYSLFLKCGIIIVTQKGRMG